MEKDITIDDANKLLEGYDIGSAQSIVRISEGLANRNYKLTTTKDVYLLKICDEKTPEELEVQVKALSHLQKNNYPAAFPIPMRNGQGYNVQGNLRAVIYTFLNGKSGKCTPSVISEIGYALGKLHALPPIDGLPAFNLNLTVIAGFLEEIKNSEFESHPFINVLREACESMKEAESTDLPVGICKGNICGCPNHGKLQNHRRRREDLNRGVMYGDAVHSDRQFNVRLKTRPEKYKELADRLSLLDFQKIAALT